MNQSREFLKRHSLIIGIFLMFLFTWPNMLANSGILPIQLPLAVYAFTGWGFIFASVIMTGLTLGKEEVIALLKRYLQWRVGWKWYLVAFGLPPVLMIAGVYVSAALTQTPLDFNNITIYKVVGKSINAPLFILPWFLYTLITNGEEIGWRGYILPRLQTKYNALTSTLLLSVIWGFWHLPFYLSHFEIIAFAWFMLHCMSLAVILTWLYNSTKGSLLMVAICHAAGNTIVQFLPIASNISNENLGTYIGYVLFEFAAAVVVTIIAGPARLSRTEKMQTQA
jgi:membrane protease YdiL (CAAX protease family)